jgi:nitroreductase
MIMKRAFSGRALFNRWALTAPVLIVICTSRKMFVHGIAGRIQGIDYDLIDIGIATEHLVLQAAALGLGTCWIGWFNDREVRKILEIPGKIRIVAMLSLGYRDQSVPLRGEGGSDEDVPVTNRKDLGEIAFEENYNSPFIIVPFGE